MKIHLKFGWLILLMMLLGSSIGPVRAENETISPTYLNEGVHGSDYLLEQANDFFVRSGFAAYLDNYTLLWTETGWRRTALLQKLPPLNPQILQQLRETLWEVLQRDPGDAKALLLSAHYMWWKGQADAALWNYRQSVTRDPESNEARLALADFFLINWQPDQVITLLQSNQESAGSVPGEAYSRESRLDPEMALRLGAAYLQKSDYFSALGYLLQAEPLPMGLQETQRKDLSKAFLGVGEFTLAKQLLQRETTGDVTSLARPLFRELQGWSAWLDGNLREAEEDWSQDQGDSFNSQFCEDELSWLKPERIPLLNAAAFKNDAALNSRLNLTSGLLLRAQKQLEPAYQAFLNGIKSDHRSLIGFLEAARCQLLLKDYKYAVNLCTQGLAVNPSFKPLLELRAAAYRGLRKAKEAALDQALAKTLRDQKINSTKFSGSFGKIANGDFYLAIQGETKNLHGLWLSPDGDAWQYQPWWGGPIYFKKAFPRLWILPVGPDLSGEIRMVQMKAPNVPRQPMAPPFLSSNGVSFNLPGKCEMIAAFYHNEHPLAHFFAGQAADQYQLSPTMLPGGNQEVFIWYRSRDAQIGADRFNLALPLGQQVLHYRLVTAQSFINRHEVKLSLLREPDSGMADYMAVAADGMTDSWRKFTPDFSWRVSPGDGRKEIIVKLKDRFENITEAKTEIIVDTAPPEVTWLHTGKDANGYQVEWRINKSSQSGMEIWTPDGEWRKIPAVVTPEGNFQVHLARGCGSFCRITAVDDAGNQVTCPVISLSSSLQADLPRRFSVEKLPSVGIYQTVTIQPGEDMKNLWSVSNDSKSWTPWKTGNEPVRWRLESGSGVKLIFIKIRDVGFQSAKEDSHIKAVQDSYIALPVYP